MRISPLILLLTLAIAGVAGPWTAPVVPDGLGVNIHFTGGPAHELDLLRAGGFRLVRMDFTWAQVERAKGVYHFDAYDQLTDGLAARGIRPLYILDYSNPLYEQGQGIVTAEGRTAFARFAAAAAARYRGRHIIWELWNEPNLGQFWRPQPSVNDYMLLLQAAAPAIRTADPDAVLIAPASSTIATDFLEACFAQGLLKLVDAVSVHPYRQTMPETVVEEIIRLRALIAKYRPEHPDVPVICGEWGYSTAWNGFTDARQGQYLPRQLLTNLSLGLPLTIWYDWHDDGTSLTDPEHHFGTVTTIYQPKPAYLAMQRLTQALAGEQCITRLSSAPDEHLLVFSDGTHWTLAAWTTADPHAVTLWPGQPIMLTGDPQYVPVPPSATDVLAESAWTVTQASFGVEAGAHATQLAPAFTLRVRNPFPQPVTVQVAIPSQANLSGRFRAPTDFTLQPGAQRTLSWQGDPPARRDIEARTSIQVAMHGVVRARTVRFLIINPLSVSVAALQPTHAAAILTLPGDDAFQGMLEASAGKSSVMLPLRIDPLTHQVTVRSQGKEVPCMRTADQVIVPLPGTVNLATTPVRVRLYEGKRLIADSEPTHLVPIEVTTRTAAAKNDGDPQVPATFTLSDIPSDTPDAPASSVLHFSFDYAAGWKFMRIAPATPLPVATPPTAFGVWVRGNQSHCLLRMRFIDATNRVFQPTFGPLTFTGWRFLTVRLDDPSVGHWGGSGDEAHISYPIRLDTFMLIDGTKQAVKDTVEFAGFQLINGKIMGK